MKNIPRLIIIDGISGAGKTTACRWLTDHLLRQGIACHTIYEADIPHPLHWWDYWDGLQHRAPDFECVPTAKYIERSIGRWEHFIEELRGSNKTTIIEGALYCLAVWFFLQADAPHMQIAGYVERVEELLRPSKPLFVYLHQRDIAAHTRRIWNERGNAVEHELIQNMERTPYLMQRGLHGFAGVVALWEETQALTDQLFTKHLFPKLILEVPPEDWRDHYAQIARHVASSSEEQ